MIRIYYGRDNINKEKFVYGNVDGMTLVVVPDQYTLVAEEQALKYLGRDCLYEVEVLSMNRLGRRALTELGTENIAVLNKYERYMLLAKVIREQRDNFVIFGRASRKHGFVSMVNDFISDFKKQDCTIDELKALIEDDNSDPILREKLDDITLIINAYEEALRGTFADNEDYITRYTEAIDSCRQFRDKTIWVYGFDTFTPKNVSAITALARVSRGVNVIVNESDFGLERTAIGMIEEEAMRLDIPCGLEHLTAEAYPEYAEDKSETVARMEEFLFARGRRGKEECADFQPVDLRVVECANTYNEAENAAEYVYELIRDHGYRLRDIAIICNDKDVLQKAIKRVFDEYGLPMYVDSKRSIEDSSISSFVVNLLDAAVYNYRTSAIIGMLKTGFAGISVNDAEELENYAGKYRIRGTMWKRPFRYGLHEYSEEQLARLNECREYVASRIEKLIELGQKHEALGAHISDARKDGGSEVAAGSEQAGGSYRAFVADFYDYLQKEWQLKDRVDALADELYRADLIEEHQWIVQCYNAVILLLDRIRDIMGDASLDFQEFAAIYTEGVLNAEVGLIPPTIDGITMGTMIRTRPAPPKAVIVVGANEGMLPLEPGTEGLFSTDEKACFAEHNLRIGSLDDIKMLEENVAMYRTMARASDKVYVSYSLSDIQGSDLKPSTLIDSIKGLFPMLKIERDVVSRGLALPLISSELPALRHLVNYLRERPEEAALKEALEAQDQGEVQDYAEAQDQGEAAVNSGNGASEIPGRGAAAVRSDNCCATESFSDGMGNAGSEHNAAAATAAMTSDTSGLDAGAVPATDSGNNGAPSIEYITEETIADAIMRWFEANDPETLQRVIRVGRDENKLDALAKELAKKLYAKSDGTFSFSASRLENFNHCPFAHFVNFGLRAEEPREFKAGSLEIGDIYHECIMKVSRRLVREGILNVNIEATDQDNGASEMPGEGGDAFGPERIAEMVSEELREIAGRYKDGLFRSDASEVYRLERIEEVCLEALIVIATQMKLGRIKASYYEENFGRGCRFEPITYTIHGETVYIEGKIDRVDVLDNDAVRIVDYKTGSDTFDLERMRSGYKMQLMVYMQGAKGDGMHPAGMFYFNISNPMERIEGKDLSGQEDKIAENEENRFKLKGLYIDDPITLEYMPKEIIYKTKRGAGSLGMSEADFSDLENDVHDTIGAISDGIITGDIRVEPTKERGTSGPAACRYCKYRAICKFDLSYKYNNYRIV